MGYAYDNTPGLLRVSQERKVVVRVETRQSLRNERGISLRHEGMFIRTESPLELGTVVDFDICIESDGTKYHGQGIVSYMALDPTTGDWRGFGVHFTRCDRALQVLCDRVHDHTPEAAFDRPVEGPAAEEWVN